MAGHAGETLIYVAGRKRMGKSTFMRACAIEACLRGIRGVAWDTTREWSSAVASLPADVRRAVTRYLRVLPGTRYSLEDAARMTIENAPCVLYGDEADRELPNHAGGLVPKSAIHAVINYGRHLGTGAMLASRRPARIHSDVPGLADRVVIFNLSAPRDVAWVDEIAGDDGELARTVRSLAQGDYVVWSPSDEYAQEEEATPEAAPHKTVPASGAAA